MNHSLLSGAIVCLSRFAYIAVFAAMVATTSPFAESAGQVGNVPFAAATLDEIPLGQSAATARLIAPGSRLVTPEGTFTGQGGADQFVATLEASFTDLEFTTETYEANDSLAVATFTMTGVHTGSYLDLPVNCAGVRVPGVIVLSIGDSGVTEQWIAYDRELLVEQIDGFHLLDPTNRPDCKSASYVDPQPDRAPALVPERVPEPITRLPEALCIRKYHCEVPR